MPSSNVVLSAAPFDDHLPKKLPRIELHHGQALWVLGQLGFQGATSKDTFYEYVKSLRKLGTPFAHGTIGYVGSGLANYTFLQLMELALVLALRVYHVVPDAVLSEVVRYRRNLYRCYRRAYLERRSGLGAPVCFVSSSSHIIQVRGAFLDLQMSFSGGKLLKFGPPKLLTPYSALELIVERDVAARAFVPMNLSLLSEKIVATALHAPEIRRGRRPASPPVVLAG